MVLYNMADTYFVGMLNQPVENAAVSLAAPVLACFQRRSIIFRRRYVQHDEPRSWPERLRGCIVKLCFWILLFAHLRRTLRNIVLFAAESAPVPDRCGRHNQERHAGLSLLDRFPWSCTGYLNVVMAYLVRSEGAALHASIGTMSGCFLNMILDPIFIMPWGLGMGLRARMRYFLSNCVACLYFFVLLYVKRGNTFVCINPRNSGSKRRLSWSMRRWHTSSIQNLLNVTGMTILNNFTSAYGATQ